MPAQTIKDVSLQHSRAFTAQEIAAAAHVPGTNLAKTVIAGSHTELIQLSFADFNALVKSAIIAFSRLSV